MKEFLKRYSLVIGIILMFLLTWPIDLANAGLLPFQVPFVIYIFLGWGFIFASLIMTGLTLGREAVINLLKRYLIWRVGWKWYLVAFLLIPFISVIGIYLNAALTQMPIDFSSVLAYQIFGSSANLLLLIIPFFLFDAIANGEEMGWRGYVLPRLQARYSALVASLILGVIWGIWHTPKFLSNWDTLVFALFMVETLAKAVLLTWMYNGTKGSLLLVTLFHASFNTAGVFLPMANTVTDGRLGERIIISLLQTLVAVVVVMYAGAERLSRTEPKQIQSDNMGETIDHDRTRLSNPV
ncbi:MAG TPA: type II CAAX endopeptidase family protein [Anaerolineales bacterium]|nr:type II CAAX endopeptidase family protein [Anaerolineales bacterium]